MNVLVINCGSSSLKYQLINSETENVLAKGLCERIGIDGRLTYAPEGGEKEVNDLAMPTHKEAIGFVLDALTNDKTGAIGSLKEVDAQIKSLLDETIELRNKLNDYYKTCVVMSGGDYSSFTDEQKIQLGTLVNGALALSALFKKTVNT